MSDFFWMLFLASAEHRKEPLICWPAVCAGLILGALVVYFLGGLK